MSADASRSAISSATHGYVALVTGVAAAVVLWAAIVGGRPALGPLAALVVLSVIIWSVGDNLVESQVGISLLGILLLASAAVLGPLGAGLIGVLVAGLSRVRTPLSARVFNMSVGGLLGVVAGVVYEVVGGSPAPEALRGLGPVAREIGLPLLVADGAQAVVNVILIAGIMRVSQGVPLRLTVARLLLTTGALAVGYGVLAALLVVLWLPGGLGPVSVVLLLAPLLGGQWALGQYAAQKRTQEQSLELLVAAIELRLPALSGHAERVGALAGRMAEHLGLGASEVSDVERAGLLHDLGQIALPPESPEAHRAGPLGPRSPHADRGARLLDGVIFLQGAAHLLSEAEPTDGDRPSGAAIVALAAAYDMATVVTGHELSVEEFCAERGRTVPVSARLVDALTWSVARTLPGGAR